MLEDADGEKQEGRERQERPTQRHRGHRGRRGARETKEGQRNKGSTEKTEKGARGVTYSGIRAIAIGEHGMPCPYGSWSWAEIQVLTRVSRTSRGRLPPLNTSSWKVRMSKCEPRCCLARSRSSRILSWPIL